MSDVFNEVDEELRREQLNRVFRKFLPWIITIMVVIVGGVAGYELWTNWDEQRKAAASESYDQASQLLVEKKWDEARTAFEEFAAKAPAGYAALSKMQAAAAAMNGGHSAEAAKLYTEAAQDFDDPLFADLANLKAVLVVYGDLSLDDIDTRLGPLAGAGRPFRALIRELMASKAMDEGNTDRAREEYQFLSLSLDTPSGAQQRAQIALSLLGPAPKKSKPKQDENSKETSAKDDTKTKPETEITLEETK